MVAVFGSGSPNLLKHPIHRSRMIAKELHKYLVTAGVFTNLEQLTASRQTRDLLGGDGLMKASQSLSDGVLGVLVQPPDIPVTPRKVHSHEAAYTNGVGVLGLLEKTCDAVLVKDGIRIHTNQVVHLIELNVSNQPIGHGVKEALGEDHRRICVANVELVKE